MDYLRAGDKILLVAVHDRLPGQPAGRIGEVLRAQVNIVQQLLEHNLVRVIDNIPDERGFVQLISRHLISSLVVVKAGVVVGFRLPDLLLNLSASWHSAGSIILPALVVSVATYSLNDL